MRPKEKTAALDRPDGWNGRATFALCVLGLFVWAGVEVWSYPAQHRLVPYIIIIPGAALSAWIIVSELRRDGEQSDEEQSPFTQALREDVERFGWAIGFIAAVWTLGFLLGGSMAAAVYSIAHREKWWTSILQALAIVGAVLLFESQFQMRFPRGIFLDLIWHQSP